MANRATDYKRQFTADHYDRMEITVPQGNKALILEHAAAKGKSINALVNDLIRVDMGLTLEEWKHIDKEQ